MNEGDDLYAQAHEVHTSLIQKEASGEKQSFPDPDACRRSDGKYGNGQGNGKEFIELYREMKESR